MPTKTSKKKSAVQSELTIRRRDGSVREKRIEQTYKNSNGIQRSRIVSRQFYTPEGRACLERDAYTDSEWQQIQDLSRSPVERLIRRVFRCR